MEILPMDLCETDDGYVIVVTDIAAEPETLVRFFFTDKTDMGNGITFAYQPTGEAHITDRKFIVRNLSGEQRKVTDENVA